MSALRLLKVVPTNICLYTTYARFSSTNATKVLILSPDEESGQASGESSTSEVAHIPQEKDVFVTADVISGVPSEVRQRLVRIYQSTRNTMQSGGAKGEKWRLDWDVSPGAGRWLNPQMGWTSSADYMQSTKVLFNTKEEAMRFAEKQGWNYYVQPPTLKRIPPKDYSETFLYKEGRLRIIRTK